MYDKHFSLANIPFSVASSSTHPEPAVVTRLGNAVIFLDVLFKAGVFANIPELGLSSHTFAQASLNAFAALGRPASKAVRKCLQESFAPESGYVPPSGAVEPISQVALHLPVHIGDFTDFSCSKDHVVNAGEAVFGERKTPPGFPHFPIGYGGRSSSIVLSGNQVRRPLGQFRSKDDKDRVEFGPCQDLDYELELGCIVGKPVKMGEIVTATNADDHIFGVVLLNDWSARDILGLEIVPLGPLNGKNFMTSISPWVVTLDALEAFAVPLPPRDVQVAPYLDDPKPNGTYAIHLQAEVVTKTASTTVCTANAEWMYWSFRHILAHQSIGGCGLQTGDIVATGTCSGTTPDSLGCLLEMTMDGKKPFKLEDGSTRCFLQDGDAVRISGFAGTEEAGVGFGECFGEVAPAITFETVRQ